MKTLISFKSGKESDHFKGARLRKTLKGACELSGISWVDSVLSRPEIIHLISPEDETKLKQSDLESHKLVISCGYCEGDPKAKFFETGPDGLVLRNKTVHFLNQADLITVPNEKTKGFLRLNGVTPPIKILQTGVNLSRFDSLSLGERIAFYRYFKVQETDPFIISIADLDNPENLVLIEKIALATPKIKFFVFSNRAKEGFFGNKNKAISKKMPKNVVISGLAEDDVYRSAMSNALAYIKLNAPYSESMQILEAFASKTQVLYFDDNGFDKDLLKEGNASYCPNVKMAASLLSSISLKPDNKTIMQAYAVARENSLVNFAAKLKEIYEQLLTERKE